MKFAKLLLGILLLVPIALQAAEGSFPGNASSGSSATQQLEYGAAELKMPAQVYDAFFGLPALLAQQETLQKRGFDLAEEEQQLLAEYKQTLKGPIMVEVGFASCTPCRVLFNGLTSTEGSSPSMLTQWQNKGGRFYQLDWVEDAYKKSDKKLSALWEVQAAPVLLFFKDGVLVARLNGINGQNPSASLAQIKSYIETIGR